jgi:hypothetical protein
MPETIVLTVSAEVASGPKLKETRTLSVDAYDKISVTVPDGTSNLEVELQPGGTGSVRLLIVKSNVYGDALKYTVNAGTTDRVLDQPHVLIGTGSVGLFGAEPTKLTFDNALGAGKDAQIEILVGRDATP